MTTRHALLRSVGALSVAGLMFTGGCEALGLGGDAETNRDRDRDRTSDRARDRERAQDRDLDRRSDDAADGVSSLPGGARMVQEARPGDRVRYRAERDGRVFALDVDAARVVYAGPVRRDDLLVLDPAAGRVDLNDRPVTATTPLSGSHGHALYFLPD